MARHEEMDLLFKGTLVAVVVGYGTACLNDCSLMAGTECTVTEGCPSGPLSRRQSNEYPGLPQDLAVDYIPRGRDVPGQNITWSNDQSKRSPDAFIVKSSQINLTSENEICTVYDINGDLSPVAHFYHNCSDPTSYYHEIFSVPRLNEDTDYVHRVVSVYEQDHDANNTASWSPYLVEMHNNSCAAEITLKFDAPPAAYGFVDILVVLISEPSDSQVAQESRVINATIEQLIFTFGNVSDGQYKLEIHPNYNENNPPGSTACACKRQGRCARYCNYSLTSLFAISSSHPKCYVAPTDSSPGPGGNGGVSPSTVAVASISTAFAIVLAVVIIYAVVRKRVSAKHKMASVKNKNDFEDDSQSTASSLWESVSQYVKAAKENQPSESFHPPSDISPDKLSSIMQQRRIMNTISEAGDVTSHTYTAVVSDYQSTVVPGKQINSLSVASEELMAPNAKLLSNGFDLASNLSGKPKDMSQITRSNNGAVSHTPQFRPAEAPARDSLDRENITRGSRELAGDGVCSASAISDSTNYSDLSHNFVQTFPTGKRQSLMMVSRNHVYDAGNQSEEGGNQGIQGNVRRYQGDVRRNQDDTIDRSSEERTTEMSIISDSSVGSDLPSNFQVTFPTGKQRSFSTDSSIST